MAIQFFPASSHLIVKRTGSRPGVGEVKGLYVGEVVAGDPGIKVKVPSIQTVSLIVYRLSAETEAVTVDGELRDVVQLANVVGYYAEPAPPSDDDIVGFTA